MNNCVTEGYKIGSQRWKIELQEDNKLVHGGMKSWVTGGWNIGMKNSVMER